MNITDFCYNTGSVNRPDTFDGGQSIRDKLNLFFNGLIKDFKLFLVGFDSLKDTART
jgi:hypothetical protein